MEPRIIFQTHKILPSIHKDATLNSQRCCAHHTTKLSRVPISAPLWLSVRGLHILKITGENHSTHSPINSKQRKTNKSSAWTKLKSQDFLNQLECDSAIGLHLLQNSDCNAHFFCRSLPVIVFIPLVSVCPNPEYTRLKHNQGKIINRKFLCVDPWGQYFISICSMH